MDLQCGIPMAAMYFLLIPRAPLQFLLLLSSIALLFSSNNRTIAIILSKHNNVTDRNSLLLFKSAISGDPHGVFAQWNDTVHFCQWHGITCGGHRHQERVVALQLSELDFVGIISPSLANLTFLRTLNLSYNNFHEQIPSELGNLPRLQHLDLSFNSLDGTIPSELSQCTGLQIIYLDYNMLGGYIPSEFGSLQSLHILVLQNNTIIGQIPPQLANASSLVSLDLSINQISGGIPPSLGKLPNLKRFVLAYNKIDGEIPASIWNRSSLKQIWFDANQLYGSLPQDIGQTLPNLQFFCLPYNNFHGEIPLSLSSASQLQTIQLQGNNFSGTIPYNLGRLQNLSWLSLYQNQLEAREPQDWSFLASLSNCTILKHLVLFDNKLGGQVPKSVANLSTSLQTLDIGINSIQGSIPQEIGSLVNLTWIDMGSNLLTGSVPDSLGLLKNLGLLDLDTNNLSGQIPSTLGNLSQLNRLYLGSNNFAGSIPTSLGNCKSLELLDLGYNKLTGTIPKEVLSIATLAIELSLVENLLTGSIPWEVGSLINLNKLGMWGNKLSGEIPSSLGKCQLLQVLSLDTNFFEGSIPKSLSALGGLQELDLSQNNFSGKIPAFLEDFHYLYYLNLSFNDLEGELPIKGVFANISAISVLGNKNLCGGIPMLHLPTCILEAPKKQHRSRKVVVIILVACAFVCVVSLLFILAAARYWIQQKRRRKAVGINSIKVENVNISYAKLNKATDGFSEANLIGSGSFGFVYQGKLEDPEHGTRVVAVKVFNLQRLGASKSFLAECDAFRNIRHRSLIKIITACSGVDYKGNDFKALVFDFMPNGNLESWLHPETNASHQPAKRLNLVQRLNIAIDVASALDYLHHHCETTLVHCDLKPSNILLNDDMVALVSDFGQARFIEEYTRSFASSLGMKGTIGYIAPEYGMSSRVSTNGDVYSYGILLLEMFTGKRPTEDTFEEGLSLRIFVEMAFPEQVMNITDACILEEGIEEHSDDTRSVNNRRYLDCVASVLRIGLLCTKDVPVERMEMKAVTNELKTIKEVLLQQY